MSKDDSEGSKIPENFSEQANENSLRLMADALRHAEGNALVALATILMAAGRSIAFSQIKLSAAMNLILAQYETMVEMRKDQDPEEVKLPDGSTWPKMSN